MLRAKMLLVSFALFCSIWSVTDGFVRSAFQYSVYRQKSFTPTGTGILSTARMMSSMNALRMSMTAETATTSSAATPTVPDMSQYSIGQECVGVVARAKAYGIVVNTTCGASILLPRSKISRGTFEKLKARAQSKSQEPVRVEILSIAVQNGTMSGTYISPRGKTTMDLSALAAKSAEEMRDLKLAATVVGAHEFGVFLDLEELGVEGLMPASKIPSSVLEGSIVSTFKMGMQLEVWVDSVSPAEKKIVLSLRSPDSAAEPGDSDSGSRGAGASGSSSSSSSSGRRAGGVSRAPRDDVRAFVHKSPERWMQALVQSVTSYGLFVRPATYDVTGMVHMSRIPRELLSILKKQVDADAALAADGTAHTAAVDAGASLPTDGASPAPPARAWSSTKTPPEAAPVPGRARTGKKPGGLGAEQVALPSVFSAGDVVSVRVFSVDEASRRLELSMLPYKPNERDSQTTDDYIVEGRDPEGEEFQAEDASRQQQEQERAAAFDPEDAMVWWRGDAYVKAAERQLRNMTPAQRRERMNLQALHVVQESQEMTDGAWRRMFEVDMREDQQDFSSKGLKKEMEELAQEIGCLEGMDVNILDTDPYRTSDPMRKTTFGAFVDPSIFPPAWREEITFFRELEEREKEIDAYLRAGKKGDQLEIENAIRAARERGERGQSARGGARQGRGSAAEGDERQVPGRRWQSASGATSDAVAAAVSASAEDVSATMEDGPLAAEHVAAPSDSAAEA